MAHSIDDSSEKFGYGEVDISEPDAESTEVSSEEIHLYDTAGNEIKINDIAQVKPGVINLPTGNYTRQGDPLIEGTNSWGYISAKYADYPTYGKNGLPATTNAVQVSYIKNNQQTVGYVVQPSGIATSRIMGNASSVAVQALNPVASLLNLNIKSTSQVSRLLGEVNTLGRMLGLKGDALRTFQTGWQNVVRYDNLVTSKIREGETLYNTVASLLFGKNSNMTTLQRFLAVLGAAQRITNYISTIPLVNKQTYRPNNSLTYALNQILSIYNQSQRVWSSIQSFTGTNDSGFATSNGTVTKYVNYPAFPGSLEGMYGMQSLTVNTAGSEILSDVEYLSQFENIEEVTNSGAININSYYKLMGQATQEGHQDEAEQINRIKNLQSTLSYREMTLDEIKKTYPKKIEGLRVVNNVIENQFDTFISKPESIELLTNEDETQIQNAFNYPVKIEDKREWIVNKVLREKNLLEESKDLSVREYDYQITIDDPNLETVSGMSIEDSLMEARKHLGIQVHGNNELGKAIKYFLYNRYKTIDGGNLAYNRLITHVFFTRPDLNLLYYKGPILDNLKNYSDVALLWQRDPNLFKLLTDFNRTTEADKKWGNNFNFLLSQQIVNWDFKDETINKVETTKNWKDQKIIYGGSYTGRGDGEINCTFLETKDLSITNLFKLWIMYIDNVTTGVWSPSYNLRRNKYNYTDDFVDYRSLMNAAVGADNTSHIYTRTLDYAASAYAFKLSENGEEILYWTKYYGLIPVSLSLNHLNWQAGGADSEAKTVNVTFAYSFKKDLSPISLLEFNHVSNVNDSDSEIFEPNFLTLYDKAEGSSILYASGIRSGEPLVGAPFIAIRTNRDSISDSNSFLGFTDLGNKFSLQLKFKPIPNTDNYGNNGDSSIDYNQIYRANPKITANQENGILANSLLNSINGLSKI